MIKRIIVNKYNEQSNEQSNDSELNDQISHDIWTKIGQSLYENTCDIIFFNKDDYFVENCKF